MTAQHARVDVAPDDLLLTAADPVATARNHIVETALTASTIGRVGLELEFHLVDLNAPARRPTWDEIQALAAGLPAMPSGSSVTVEPGGQLELSTPPAPDTASSVFALQADRAVLGAALASAGFGTAPLGTDPARPVRRVNPSGRYVAMEQHFAALGCEQPGKAMMSATAALQVNLDAGPEAGWSQRLDLIRSLGPVLVAASACSPYLGGHSSGWHSMRQQIWHGIDHSRSDPVTGREPGAAWASYALNAPVMLVRDGDRTTPVTRRVPFRAWLRGASPIDRRPTLADLDYHLTTLFPPIRPRGYIEIRCLDALPDRWWPALAALTVTLIDDAETADRAAELCEPVRDSWPVAARAGLADPTLRAAVQGCVDAAARRCPAPLKADVEAYAELILSGRTPGDEVRERVADAGPLAVLEEEARA
ncbi:MAG: ergothioneine biosynthesis glutamate--cysteine ligase EgtA [Jatrophihabitans sp.]|uniref:ergothioneine biosynthesis glutamate--cysteine ligase EgtA n=1 Tax=Jatrophihabitans sp. TaxID=1932789 RepID=UPI003913CB44